ncbi:MAG: MBL fold metallo-hydrolase [Gammaproteobacteria bacterium]|nr:MBL fold metallo-hydrolase [Gammaproteobacteria bacterium]
MLSIKFYGVRGSISVSGDEYQEFGGNTTCIQIMVSDTNRIGIMDAGTGIRQLGNDIMAMNTGQSEIFIAFSHFHWDHIQGLPFFAPAYVKDMNINILALGQNRKIENLKDIFDMQMQKQFFPITMDEMGANFNFLSIDKHSKVFMPPDGIPVKMTAALHNHPGGAYSYRYERKGQSIVISTDIEHGDEIDQNIVKLAQNADLLVHDAQYTAEVLKTKKGWGHSSYDQAIEVARQAKVKKLIITHHDPDHDDEFLRKMEKWCQQRFSQCELAREGKIYEV